MDTDVCLQVIRDRPAALRQTFNANLMIAGHARSRGLVVVTHNRREFGRVDGLRIEDWIEAAERGQGR